MGLQHLAAMVLPQAFRHASDAAHNSNHHQEADEENLSDSSDASEIPFKKTSLTEASDDSDSDDAEYEDDPGDLVDNESDSESSTDEVENETEQEQGHERVEIVSSDLPACAACNV